MAEYQEKAQRLDQLNEQALEKLQQLTYEKHLETARRLRDERVETYVTKGIQQAAHEFKSETKQIFQGYLNQFNQNHAKAIVDAEANLPEIEPDPHFDLEMPSLEQAVQEKKSSYGVLRPSEDESDLPEDLQTIFEE